MLSSCGGGTKEISSKNSMHDDAKKAATLRYEWEISGSETQEEALNTFEKYCMEKYSERKNEFMAIFEDELAALKTVPKTNDTKSNSTKHTDWDKILDNYEQYVEQYVKLYKKAQQGDMSALTEYTSVLDKANKLASQLERANNDLSSKQVARFSKIQSKLLSIL